MAAWIHRGARSATVLLAQMMPATHYARNARSHKTSPHFTRYTSIPLLTPGAHTTNLIHANKIDGTMQDAAMSQHQISHQAILWNLLTQWQWPR
jgi:hypothetical protein